MSQHHIVTHVDGETITVMLGWDRPLSGFFMVVTKPVEKIDDLDGSTYTDVDYLYCNLNDSKLKHGLSHESRYFKTVLSDLNITCPDEIYSIIDNDKSHNIGNLVAVYEILDGSLKATSRHDNF